MRKLLFTLAMSVGVAAMAQSATDAQQPAERAAQRTEQMAKDLGLNPEQVEKVAAINRMYAQGFIDVQAVDEKDRNARIQELMAGRDRSFKAVLTEEQYETFLKLRSEHGQER